MKSNNRKAFMESVEVSGASPALIRCIKDGFALCEGVFSELDIEMREAAEKLRTTHGPEYPVKTVLEEMYPGIEIPANI